MARLSNEILETIFENFVILATPRIRDDEARDREDRLRLRTLCSISLTSHRLRDLARPLFFRVLSFDHVRLGHGWVQPPVKPALRTLCSCPSLQKAVQGIRLGRWEPGDFRYEPRPSYLPPSAELAELYNDALRGLHFPQDLRSRLEDGLIKGNRDAELAFVLALTTNLSWLDFSHFYRGHWVTSLDPAVAKAALLTHAGAVGPTLKKLQRLDVNVDILSAMSVHDVSPFPGLPALRSMTLQRTLCDSSLGPGVVSSSLRSVEFIDSHVNTTGLRTLLHSCPQLEELRMEMARELCYFEIVLSFEEVGEVICELGKSLMTWSLEMAEQRQNELERVGPGNSGSMLREDAQLPLQTLSTLALMEHLALPLDALIQCKGPWCNSNGDIIPEDSCNPFALIRRLPISLRTLRLYHSTQGLTQGPIRLPWNQDPEPATVDQQLLELMRHNYFKSLCRIEMLRNDPDLSHDLSALGAPWHTYQERRHTQGSRCDGYYHFDCMEDWQIFERL